MFKKTRVRQIIELLQKNLSDREISNVLGVSRNSVARIRQVSDGYNGEWEELLMMTDDELYRFFYPDKFKPKNSYASVDYIITLATVVFTVASAFVQMMVSKKRWSCPQKRAECPMR